MTKGTSLTCLPIRILRQALQDRFVGVCLLWEIRLSPSSFLDYGCKYHLFGDIKKTKIKTISLTDGYTRIAVHCLDDFCTLKTTTQYVKSIIIIAIKKPFNAIPFFHTPSIEMFCFVCVWACTFVCVM